MKIIAIMGLFILMLITVQSQGQEKKSKKQLREEKKVQQIEETKSIVESGTFVFKATNANPMRGRTINLTTEYDVKVSKDSIYSYLPYYGVAYSASYGGTDSPMIFESPAKTYSIEETKKGYRIKVTAKNGNDNLEFNFNVTVTGSTSLTVISVNRQSISYFGTLEKIKKK
jgi:TctA family transporter